MSASSEDLIKATKQEMCLAEALTQAGLAEAKKSSGPGYMNRKYGDVWYRLVPEGDQHAIELQVSPGDGNRTNFSLSLTKKDKFLGRGGERYYMFGNEQKSVYMIVEKETLDELIDEYDQDAPKDVIIYKADTYVLISPEGLAASGHCLGFGKTIEECAADFAKNIRQ